MKEGAWSAPPPRDFLAAITAGPGIALIAEIKKASPSRGVIRADFDPASLAAAFARGGARALSVLTDREHFQGALSHLAAARDASGLPVLRKDFLMDLLQVYEAREAGADAVLLIAAALEDSPLRELRECAESLGMAALVEVHDEEEMDRAAASGAKLLGVNNRNLKDFTVDLGVSLRLLPRRPAGVPVVSESGVFSRADVERLFRAGACAVLVGEGLAGGADAASAVRALLPGEV